MKEVYTPEIEVLEEKVAPLSAPPAPIIWGPWTNPGGHTHIHPDPPVRF